MYILEEKEDAGVETIGDLVERLSRLPQDAPIVISDADTDRPMRIAYIGILSEEHPTRIVLAGDYYSKLAIPE